MTKLRSCEVEDCKNNNDLKCKLKEITLCLCSAGEAYCIHIDLQE